MIAGIANFLKSVVSAIPIGEETPKKLKQKAATLEIIDAIAEAAKTIPGTLVFDGGVSLRLKTESVDTQPKAEVAAEEVK